MTRKEGVSVGLLIGISILALTLGFRCRGEDCTNEERAAASFLPDTSKTPMFPKIYIESSGSMYPYDTIEASDFRPFLTMILNQFTIAGTTNSEVFVVNDNVYKHKYNTVGDLSKSMDDLFDKGKGNKDYTDFAKIFTAINRDINDNQIGILFSDLIISKEKTQYNENILAQDIQAYFNDIKKKGISVLVCKLSMKFRGFYYYESPSKKMTREFTTSNRPLYMLVFSKDNNMKKFLSNPRYERLRNKIISDQSFRNSHLFLDDSQIKRLQSFDYTINIGAAQNDNYTLTELLDCITDDERIHGVEINMLDDTVKPTLSIDAWVSNFVYDNQFLLNKSNYQVISPVDGFAIDSIWMTPHPDSLGRIKVTYQLTATKNGNGKRQLSIQLIDVFPVQWINNTDTQNDYDIHQPLFDEHTYLFRGLMNGIYGSYNMNPGKKEIIKIHIND